MKNAIIVFGFILCAVAGFALMNISSSIVPTSGPWAPGGKHLTAIERIMQPILDKCKLDRLQGRLKNHEESVGCSNPAMKEAFIKEGFTNEGKLDEYLKQRKDYAIMLDKNEITEDQKSGLTLEAMDKLLEFAPAEEAKK